MKKSRPAAAARLYTPRATLCALGRKVRALKLFDAIAERVRIRQKTIRHMPLEKLRDAFIAILAGAHGLVEVNTRVRSDAAVRRSFGREACAEQSVVQEPLDRCAGENVRQMGRVMGSAYAEVVADRLYPGNQPTAEDLAAPGRGAGERSLEMEEAKRRRSQSGTVKRVVLNSASTLGRACAKALRLLLEAEHVRVTLGET
jgi:hypothetical protein